MPESLRSDIQAFLGLKRIAVVGVSRKPQEYNRHVFEELRTRGYDVVPVNPNAAEIGGLPCFASVAAVDPPVEAALVMTGKGATDGVVAECEKAGIRRVWIGLGSATTSAVDFCHEHGMSVIPNHCPYMFLPKPGFIHSFHGGLLKLFGKYPG